MIQQFFTTLATRLKTATPRERAGLAAIFAVATVVAAVSAFDWALRSGDRQLEARQRRADIEAAYARDGDREFQERIATDTNKVWRWSIVESSPVLAQARAVDLAQALAAQAGLVNAEFVPVESDEATSALRTIRVRMAADFDWYTFLALLEALESSDTSFFAEAVGVDASGEQAPRLSLTLVAPFIEDAPS